jgi:hypothetical protein
MVNLIGLRYSGLVLIFTEYLMSFPCEKMGKNQLFTQHQHCSFSEKNRRNKKARLMPDFLNETELNLQHSLEGKGRISGI